MLDITGKYFGRLTPLFLYKLGQNNAEVWLCECLCGNIKAVTAYHLKVGKILSCGCIKQERYHHPVKGTRLYSIWKNMRTRCNYTKKTDYHRYGGRGIKVCGMWNSFKSFYAWAIANGYSDDLTLDRINNDGDYCPENCRWISRQRQSNNMSTNHLITYKGITQSIADWERITGISQYAIWQRLYNLNWSLEEALTLSTGTRRV